jgi:hypothetical protein
VEASPQNVLYFHIYVYKYRDEAPVAAVPLRVACMVVDSGYCSRADSMHAFKEMNFELPRHKGQAVPWADRSSFPDKVEIKNS